MKCHYQVLGVEQNADDGAITKAYRKAALKCHPDKNLHCPEEATEKFRLVQAAYEVLSDPVERAWYDRHREEILHRKKYENYKENSIDLWEYFTPSATKGFGDDEKGFYTIYRDVFKKIDAEDQPFRDEVDEEWLPSFGNSESKHDDVHEFYSAWQSYCTRLSYVWESQYDVKEAPNRRVARIIEKENKKERDKHKKKRNELVRELVAYVRKRDPRVKAHKAELERIAAEQAKKAEEHRMSLRRAKAEEAALYDEANRDELLKHNERVSELENMMKDEFGFSSSDNDDNSDLEEDEDDEYSDDLFCVACNKLFKSSMGLRNHEKSKKHKESMNRLKQEMQEELAEHCDEEEQLYRQPSVDMKEKSTKLSKKQKKQKRQQQKLLSNTMNSQPWSLDQLEKLPTVENNETSTTIEQTTDCIDQLATPNPSTDRNSPGLEDRNTEDQLPVLTEVIKSNDKPKNKRNRRKKKDNSPTQTMNSDFNTESLGCGKCNLVFSSRNKLFQHLKKTGHSLPIK